MWSWGVPAVGGHHLNSQLLTPQDDPTASGAGTTQGPEGLLGTVSLLACPGFQRADATAAGPGREGMQPSIGAALRLGPGSTSGTHSFGGRSLLGPLPGKATKLFFSTSPKPLSPRFNLVPVHRG